MSFFTQRARPVTMEFFTVPAILFTASKSAGAGSRETCFYNRNPQTFKLFSNFNFFRRFRLMPGDCSPSRKSRIKNINLTHYLITNLTISFIDERHHFTQFRTNFFDLMLLFAFFVFIECGRPFAFSSSHSFANLPFWISSSTFFMLAFTSSVITRGPDT